ncbi:MAG: glycosyl transferase family 2 [Mucilaginibacter sp.]|uniref:glycosyltransferase n=1 Tax=Mucilaginibacter sp. TaxID=1882438 RepID=UPI00263A1CA8|nr:glycosyltransferase [Mucilaginibacter sp.]MDB5001951.1 glycosyl transferase family 2 [Mucilaginibacter sp.]
MSIVSVVMPVYNAAEFLRSSIDSILNQSLTDLEFIIINDGSTDTSHNIISSYTDPRIKYINKQKNQGLVKCLNEAIEIANGPYIARMDADDIAYKDRLTMQVSYLQQNKHVKLVGAHVRLIDINSKPFGTWRYPTSLIDVKKEIKNRCCFAHPSVVFEKNIFNELGGYYPILVAEDYDLWVRILNKYEGINLDCILTDYRIHSTNYSSTHLLKQSLACLAIKYNIPANCEVDLPYLSKNGLSEIEIVNHVVNSFLFWIEVYRKMRDPKTSDNLLSNLKSFLNKMTNNNKANILVLKYEIKYSFFLLRFATVVRLYYQYLYLIIGQN